MTTLILLAFAVLAGGLIAFQSAVNGQLGRVFDSPLLAAFVSFTGGTITLFIILLLRGAWSTISLQELVRQPPVLYLGGILGASYVAIIAALVPKIGLANTAVALVLGQMLISLLLDQIGILGFDIRAISWSRLAGIGLVVLGVVLVIR